MNLKKTKSINWIDTTKKKLFLIFIVALMTLSMGCDLISKKEESVTLFPVEFHGKWRIESQDLRILDRTHMFPNIELLSDGTAISFDTYHSYVGSWRVADSRFVITLYDRQGLVFDFQISELQLNLSHDSGTNLIYLKY